MEYPVKAQQTINVTLDEDSKALNEVVVVGYGTQRKALVTNAISSFKPTESNMRPVLTPSELLQGRGIDRLRQPGKFRTNEHSWCRLFERQQ